MALGELIFNRLTTYAATSTLLGNRCYPALLPQEPVLPAVTYDVRSGATNEGSLTLTQVLVQVSCWATTYAGAVALGESVKGALRQYQQKASLPALISMTDENEADLYDPETGIYGRLVEFSAWVVETPP